MVASDRASFRPLLPAEPSIPQRVRGPVQVGKQVAIVDTRPSLFPSTRRQGKQGQRVLSPLPYHCSMSTRCHKWHGCRSAHVLWREKRTFAAAPPSHVHPHILQRLERGMAARNSIAVARPGELMYESEFGGERGVSFCLRYSLRVSFGFWRESQERLLRKHFWR